MPRTARTLLLAAVAVVAAGCLAPGAVGTVASPGGPPGGAPTFAPDPGAGTASTGPEPAPSTQSPALPVDEETPDMPDPAPTSAPTPPPASPGPSGPADTEIGTETDAATPVVPPPPSPEAARVGAVDDPAGDLAGDDPDRAPRWADLVGATIRLADGRGEIVLRFAGAVPGTGRAGEAVNVATFHDLTGDGRIDREIWASQTSDGWGTSYWDNQAGTVRFADEDDVDVVVEGDTVRLAFPAQHLADATTGRWQVTLEWVDQALLTQRLAVDDAPDDRGGARWAPTG